MEPSVATKCGTMTVPDQRRGGNAEGNRACPAGPRFSGHRQRALAGSTRAHACSKSPGTGNTMVGPDR